MKNYFILLMFSKAGQSCGKAPAWAPTICFKFCSLPQTLHVTLACHFVRVGLFAIIPKGIIIILSPCVSPAYMDHTGKACCELCISVQCLE